MKVLQVIVSLDTGGAEKLLVDSVPLFLEKGLDVDVLLLKDSKTIFRETLEKKATVNIIALTKGSVYNPMLVFKLIPIIKRYDLIHAHLFPVLYWVVLAKFLSFSKVKIVYTEHNTSNRRRNNYMLRVVDKWMYKRLNRVVTIAEEVDKNLKRHIKLPDENIEIINNGVDIDYYNKATPYVKEKFFSEEDIILIQVSSFTWQKDQPTLIRSLQFLPNKVKLLLVGEGRLKKDCIALVTDLGLSERILFLGNRRDVPQLLNTSDIIILSSKHEGLSLSNIEGMSVNKPFIGSNVPGIREIVSGYGMLFEQGNEKELADLILKLINNPKHYKLIAESCYRRAMEFDIHRMVDSYKTLYKTVVNE